MRQLVLTIGPLTLLPSLAHAYIGPGAGAGTIAVVLGVIAAVLMAFVGLIWYPLKRLFRGRSPAKPGADTSLPSKGS